jgi:uncharacterized membrane protein YccF (DUF307 family)
MSTIGNLIWLICGGILAGLIWLIVGALMICTIIGIPYARACFVIAKFNFLPFGRELIKRDELRARSDLGTGALGLIANVIWILLFGWWIALLHLFAAGFSAITIVGIPFALQHLKLAAVCFAPVGRTVVKKHLAEAAWMHNAQTQLQQIRSNFSEQGQYEQSNQHLTGRSSASHDLGDTSSKPRPFELTKLIVARGDQTLGEFTEPEIQGHISTGFLIDTDWFWNSEKSEWQAIRTIAKR